MLLSPLLISIFRATVTAVALQLFTADADIMDDRLNVDDREPQQEEVGTEGASTIMEMAPWGILCLGRSRHRVDDVDCDSLDLLAVFWANRVR